MKTDKYKELLNRPDVRLLTYISFTTFCQKEFLEKNKEYGQTWLAYRPKSLLKRLWNKAYRVRSIQDKKEQHISDSIVSEFDAIYNYCIIALIVVDKIVNQQLEAIIPLELNPSTNTLDEHYKSASEKCQDLFKKKDHDYNGAWVQMCISEITDEILVKLRRASTILSSSSDVPIEDFKKKMSEIFIDVANYAIFASILIKDIEQDPLE